MALNPELLAMLVCPVCKNALTVEGNEEGLCCARCSVVYPVKEEIPLMLAEEAIPLRQWTASRSATPGVASEK